MPKRSKKDFQIFKDEVEYWVDYFKLYNWYIRILFATEGDTLESMQFIDNDERDAWSMIDHRDHLAIIFLNSNVVCHSDLESEYELKAIAFHEVCEVLLFPLSLLAEESYSDNVVIKNTHIIINHLENSVFKGKHGNTRRNVDKT